MLKVEKISVGYGEIMVLHEVSLEINEGEIVALIGSNAAGKTTMINTISGRLKPRSGSISFNGLRIDRLPVDRIVDLGIVQVPEGRRLFPEMTVLENLELGAYTFRARKLLQKTLCEVYEYFPILYERRNQLAGSLSGGEQQMCAIGRGLMARPKLLMLDEISLGLAPLVVRTVYDVIKKINQNGTTIFLVEQNVQSSLALATKGFVLENGRMVLCGESKDLLQNPELKKAYLGM